MSLLVEVLLHTARTIFHNDEKDERRNFSPKVLVVSEDSPENTASPSSMTKRAHAIADNVRKCGEQKFGEMWAQGYVVLPDGRMAFLQQSQEESQIHPVLEIDIPCTSRYPRKVHIRYDLEDDAINTFDVRQADGTPITAYWIHDRPDQGTRVPADLTLHDIVDPVDEILKIVVVASGNITWTEPQPTG